MAITFGAALGALSRWLLVLAFAALSVPFSVGTLAANWIGAFLIGICAEWLDNPQWKLLLITGFLGSLTTFSSFSLEMVTLMQEQIINELFGAQTKDEIKGTLVKSFAALAQHTKDSAEQKAREMIKENGDKINSQIEKFMNKNADINAMFKNIGEDLKIKIAKDFNIKF